MNKRKLLIVVQLVGLLLVLNLVNTVFAADSNLNKAKQPKQVQPLAEDNSIVQLEEMEVIGTPDAPLAPQQSSLKGKALQIQQGDTLGKTLEQELGVSNASFGPGVGLPVVRGLTGSRVRLLQSGIGSHDASSLSPDHAVAIEPLFAEEITVLRGPETIRYGGNAIGGIVDVKDNRIPERLPKQLITGALETRYDTNGEGTNSAFKVDIGKEWLALNVAGFFRSRGDTRIPGQAIDAAFIEQQFGLTGVNNVSDTIPNTDNESLGGSVGLSWLGDKGMAGLSVSHTDNQYGVPKGSHALDPNHLEGGLELILPQITDLSGFEDVLGTQALFPNIRLDMQQTRYDFKSEWYEPLPGIERIGFRYGLVDYQHVELERGLPFSTFKNDVGEGRVEIDHHGLENLTGTVGVQWINRDFSALGVETYVPETQQDSLGFYTTQAYTLDQFEFKLGLRTEQSWIDPNASSLKLRGSALPATPLPDDLKFQAESASFAIKWALLDQANLTLTLNRGKRSPDIQELLSLGPHLSTRSFDIGNVQLKNETVNMVDLGFDWQAEGLEFRANAYYNQTDDFIYQRNTGFVYEVDTEVIRQRCVSAAECLPMYAYDQRDATFIGYEAEAKATLAKMTQGDVSLKLFSDYVRGTFSEGDVPRLPPLRYGAELGFGNEVWNTALRYTRSEAQDRAGLNENATGGFHLLTATADYQLKLGDAVQLSLFAKASNLLNEEMRSSVSFLRNYAPEPGRSFVFGLRATF
ncbi:MAG: TonB-dependent receptor [Methylococcales bacterium]